MTYFELMEKSLSDLLEENEILKYPIYATLMQGFNYWFGFFGLTDRHILIALLAGDSKQISNTIRIPREIKKVSVKKSIIPYQYKVHIYFKEGHPLHIRASKKVLGFATQPDNVTGFLKEIQNLPSPHNM